MSDSTWVPIRDQIESGFAFIVRYIFPVVVAVSGAFNLPGWAMTVISKIVPALIGIVEQASPAPGTGAAKKQAVLDATEKVLVLVGGTLTGGAAVNFEQIRPALSVIIDSTVTATNALAPKVIANDTSLPARDPSIDSP